MSQSKTIFIVRHAKSSWNDSCLSDFDRPLNKRGLNDAPKMGKIVASSILPPKKIISSPAKRASDTAQIISEALGLDSEKILKDNRIYEADIQQLLNVIHSFDSSLDCVMLVGHNPGLTDLVNLLTNEYIVNIPTCSIIILKFNTTNWEEIIADSGVLTEYHYPKKF